MLPVSLDCLLLIAPFGNTVDLIPQFAAEDLMQYDGVDLLH
jgi:hypothetical protein